MIAKAEFWRLFRFGIVGGGATLVDLATAKLCLFLWPVYVGTSGDINRLFCRVLGFLLRASLCDIPVTWQDH